MMINKNKFFLSFFILLISVAACKNEEDEATNSIRGTWEVTSISSLYGHFVDNGFNPSETITENGILGEFVFTGDSVAYEFMRNDTLYSGNDVWSLTSEKVNAGFTRETEYTLIIENNFLLNVSFGDGTKNSERNAESAIFIETPEIGFGVLVEIELEKQ